MKNYIASLIFVVMAVPSPATSLETPALPQAGTQLPTTDVGHDLTLTTETTSPRTFVVIQPPSDAPWHERYQTAWSTLVAALFGFGGIILTTKAGFRHSRDQLTAQAGLDREARKEHWAAERRLLHAQWQWDITKAEREIHEERKKLASALAAELTDIRMDIDIFCRVYEPTIETLKVDPKNTETFDYVVKWNAPCTIYKHNINNLGVFDSYLIRQIVTMYSFVESNDEIVNTFPLTAAIKIETNVKSGKKYIQLIDNRLEVLKNIYESNKELELPL